MNLGKDTTLEATFELADGVTSSTATSATTVTPAPTYVLGVQNQGKGTVRSTPPAIDCGPTCRVPLASGTAVTLTAAPGQGARFAGWQGGGCSGTGACTVTMTKDQSVTAAFEPVIVKVSVDVDGKGTVTSAPQGISCSTTCSFGFPDGTKLTLIAQPGAGHEFDGWLGACKGQPAKCLLTLSGEMAAIASFRMVQPTTSKYIQPPTSYVIK